MVAKVADRLTRPLSNRESGVLAHTTYKAPKTRFNGRISPHRRFSFGQLSLDEVKEVKNRYATARSTMSSSRSARARCGAGCWTTTICRPTRS